MTGGENQPGFILLCEIAGQFNPVTKLEFRITIIIEGERKQAVLEAEIGIEKKGVFVENFAFVAALRNFRGDGNRASVTEQIAVAILHPENPAFESAIAD